MLNKSNSDDYSQILNTFNFCEKVYSTSICDEDNPSVYQTFGILIDPFIEK